MGAADEGASRVEPAAAGNQQGTGGVGSCLPRPRLQLQHLCRGQGVQRRRQGRRLYREELQMAAAAVAPPMAKDMRPPTLADLATEFIDASDQGLVICEVRGHDV